MTAHACKHCGNEPDDGGCLEHGKGCYRVDDNGGGIEYIPEADTREHVGAPMHPVIVAAERWYRADGNPCGAPGCSCTKCALWVAVATHLGESGEPT